MLRTLRISVAGLLLLSPLSLVFAQATKEKEEPKEQKPKTTVSKDRSLKTANVAEADPAAVERRNVAVSLLTSLADDARSFRDQKLRARVLARTADAL